MVNAVARLVSVAVREVWSDEALELTPFLAANPDYLSEALGMDLELEGAEVTVGPFAADLLFREQNTGERVVVENLIGNTDHDHLGKIITYAAGLDARQAVLIAETFRPEHRSALLWLNANSRESVGFFGIVLKLWRIEGAPADSPAALQLNVVVQPDEWARRVREDRERKLTDTQVAYRDFWSEFLPVFHARHTSWSRTKVAPTRNWLSLPAGKVNVFYAAGFCVPQRFRIELYVDGQDPDNVTRRFNALMERRGGNRRAVRRGTGVGASGVEESESDCMLLSGRCSCRRARPLAGRSRLGDRPPWPTAGGPSATCRRFGVNLPLCPGVRLGGAARVDLGRSSVSGSRSPVDLAWDEWQMRAPRLIDTVKLLQISALQAHFRGPRGDRGYCRRGRVRDERGRVRHALRWRARLRARRWTESEDTEFLNRGCDYGG